MVPPCAAGAINGTAGMAAIPLSHWHSRHARRTMINSPLPPHFAACSALQLMAAGVPVVFLAGGGLCWGHLVYAWKTALKFRVLPEGVKYRNIHRFWTEFDVEIASRIGRVWDVEGALDQTALEVAENVLKVRSGAAALRARGAGREGVPASLVTMVTASTDQPYGDRQPVSVS